jgi:dCTP deaminase
MSNASPIGNLFSHPKPEQLTGVLPSQVIRTFIDAGKIISPAAPISDSQLQPASLDLRLGRKAYQVKASFIPGQSTIANKIQDLLIREINLEDTAVLEPGSVFIVPLLERLDLPPDVYAKANPKSTTGRLDIFTRLITEPGKEFELVPKGYSGALYLEVVSRTFPVAVRTGMKLNQMRFIRGKSDVSDGMLSRLAATEKLVYEDDENALEPEIQRGLRV